VARELEYLDEALERRKPRRAGMQNVALRRPLPSAMKSMQPNLPSLAFRMHGLASTQHAPLFASALPFTSSTASNLKRILIVAVAHGHRRPGYWKSRTQTAP